MSCSTAARGVMRPSSTAVTARVIGMSTPSSAARRATSRAAGHAFGDMAEFAGDVGQRLAFGQQQADATIARQVAGAGQHQVAHAGQAHEGFAPGAERFAEAGNLDQAARDQRGAGVVAETEAVADAGGDGQHVLHRTADLGADQVFIGIDAQVAAMQAARWTRQMRHRSAASVTAVGRPRATSRAKLGPVSTPQATSPITASPPPGAAAGRCLLRGPCRPREMAPPVRWP
jgi:hypothetical protein